VGRSVGNECIADGAVQIGHNATDSLIQIGQFLDARLGGEVVILFLRRINRGSILPIAFKTLVVRWPRLCFKIPRWSLWCWIVGM
jgi:hypothetical protein